MATVRRAMLLAAGGGTRLRPLTDRRPKPMVEVGGRPLMEHTVLQLARAGVRELVINLHHCADAIRDHFGDGTRYGVRIAYSYEPELLGTSGGVKRAGAYLEGEPFFLVYADNLTTVDFARLSLAHASGGALATIALFWKDDVSPHSSVELSPDGDITRFVEKPKREEALSHWISAGMAVMEPDVIATIPDGRSDFGSDVFPLLLKTGHRIRGYTMRDGEGLWWIDTPGDYERICQLWKNGTAPI
jgi:mannose-1-phosphate guanylyltransferase